MATNTSATSQNHNGTGSQANFSISFPFLLNSEIEVTVGGVLKTLGTHYNIVGSQVQFTSGNIPASGTANVVFNRDTNISTKRVDFEDGSVLTEADLDNNVNQILFAQQEIASDYVKRDGTQTVTGDLVFEGSVDDTNETTLAITNPTADRTITVPDRSGTLITSGDTGTVTSTMIADGTIVNADVNASASIDGTKISPNFGSQNIVTSGTVDGRDVSVDGSKLDGIESGATADQTASEIRTLVESASDSNVFTDADHSKLNAIEAGATADQTAAEIRTLVESASDSNVFTDADHTKLNAIEAGATADQTVSEIKSLIAGSPLDASHLAANSVDTTEIASGAIDSTKLNANTVVTNSEQASANVNDTSFFTTSASDARYFNISSGDTIKDGQSFPDNDTTIATTAAINDRIIDLVDDVGGFVPIANETSFPTTNPDAENGTGTVVSVKAASTDLTPSGTTVTIANGAGSGNTVTITGVPSVISSGFGFLVETTTTTHTYTFHRLVPKATEVTAVAGKAVEIGRLGTADAVADMAILGTTDVVADMNLLGTSDVVADMALLATTDVIADMALLAVADVISDMNDLATSGNITAMSTCSTNIASINNASSNISSVNNFGDKYQIAANDPSTDGGGNALAVGDLYFNTSANELKIYNGSSWQGGVTASGNFASTTGNTFTGDNRYNDNVKALFGTGSDLEIYHNNNISYLANTNGSFLINTAAGEVQINKGFAEYMARFQTDGYVYLYYDGNKKFETTSSGATVTGSLGIGTTSPARRLHQHVDNSFANYHLFTNSTTGSSSSDGLLLGINATEDGVIWNHENTALKFATNNTERLKITNDGHVQIPANNKKLQIGANQQLQIYRDNSNSFVTNTTSGALFLRSDNFVYVQNEAGNKTMATFRADTSADLYYDNSKKFETTSSGAYVTGHLEATGTLTCGQLNSGTQIVAGNPTLRLKTTNNSLANKGTIEFYYNTSNLAAKIRGKSRNGANGQIYLDVEASGTMTNIVYIHDVGLDMSHGNLNIPNDTYKLRLGEGSDLQLFHNGSNSYIDNLTGILYIRPANDFYVQNRDTGEVYLKGVENGAVELYYDNVKKFETISTGVQVTGEISHLAGTYTNASGGSIRCQHDSGKITAGAGNDLEIYHDGTRSYIDNNTGDLRIRSDDVQIRGSNDELIAVFYENSSVDLYYNGSKKFETTSGGAAVVGDLALGNITSAAHYYDNGLHIHSSGTGSVIHLTDSTSGSAASDGFDILSNAGTAYLWQRENANMVFGTNAASRWSIYGSDGHFVPSANNTYDIGTTSNRVANVYTNDLHLSNEGSVNDVDGTWGSYTIQEGAEDLYLINRRNGKKYKFALMEVS